MCHTSIKPPTSTPTTAAGGAHPQPTQAQPNPSQQEPASEHQGEQDPHEAAACLSEEKSESESLDRRTSLQDPHCGSSGDIKDVDAAVPSSSSEGNPFSEGDMDSEQRTHHFREPNLVTDSGTESTGQPERYDCAANSQSASGNHFLR